MEAFFSIIDTLIGTGIIALELSVLVLLVAIIVGRVPASIAKNAMLIAAVLSLIAALGTLYYSEIVGVLPCKLCWYQRALLYPQVLIFAYGFFKKDRGIFPYTIALSALGLFVALYHVMLPLITNPFLCDPTTERCIVQYVTIFNYITIPVMSMSVFAALLLLSVIGYRTRKVSVEALPPIPSGTEAA